MDKTYLPDLISGLKQELLRLGYTKGSMTFYRRRWNQLMAYAEDRGECYYTEQLGMDFLKEFFGITQEDFSRTLPQAETQEIRVVRMVGDFQLHHAVLRRYLKHKELLTTPFFVDIRSRFQSSCEKKGYSQVTTEHYVKQSSYLMDYLAAQGMDDFTAVTLDTVNAYIRTLAGFSYKTVEQHICSLRAFFRFLNQEGIMQDDLAAKMPMVKARKQTAIPSVWTQEELKQLVGAIDRGSPKGKRDYAIILIAAVWGCAAQTSKTCALKTSTGQRKNSFLPSPKQGSPWNCRLSRMWAGQ